MDTTIRVSSPDEIPPRGSRPRPCPGRGRILPLVRALARHPGLDPAERCAALHGLKQALCWPWCLEVCDRWARELARGEQP